MLIRDQVFNVKSYLNKINKNKKRKKILQYLQEIKELMLSHFKTKLTRTITGK